jgi:hypothetical protein
LILVKYPPKFLKRVHRSSGSFASCSAYPLRGSFALASPQSLRLPQDFSCRKHINAVVPNFRYGSYRTVTLNSTSTIFLW